MEKMKATGTVVKTLMRDESKFEHDVYARIKQATNSSHYRLARYGVPMRPHQALTHEKLCIAAINYPGLPPNLEDYELDHIFPVIAWLWLDRFICKRLRFQDVLTRDQIALLNSSYNLQWLTKQENAAKGDQYELYDFISWLGRFPGVFDEPTYNQMMAYVVNRNDYQPPFAA